MRSVNSACITCDRTMYLLLLSPSRTTVITSSVTTPRSMNAVLTLVAESDSRDSFGPSRDVIRNVYDVTQRSSEFNWLWRTSTVYRHAHAQNYNGLFIDLRDEWDLLNDGKSHWPTVHNLREVRSTDVIRFRSADFSACSVFYRIWGHLGWEWSWRGGPGAWFSSACGRKQSIKSKTYPFRALVRPLPLPKHKLEIKKNSFYSSPLYNFPESLVKRSSAVAKVHR